MVTFHGLENIEISTSVKNKKDYYENCKEKSEQIITEFNNQLFKYDIVFSLAIPHNFFTIKIDGREQNEICNAIDNLSSDLKNWIY
ncbi:MAG: hypothetical protein ACYC01_04645 [Lutibacter sp.]